MTTGLAFANIEPKKILSNEDLRERMMDYFREYVRQHFMRAFAKSGIFGPNKWTLGLSAFEANTVVVGMPAGPQGYSYGVDSQGHLINVGYGGDPQIGQITDTVFENTPGQRYHIAYGYCAMPTGITVNPRNGLPQFSYFVDAVGRRGNVDSVQNNGNGTLTFSINTMCDGSGHSYNGRLVKIWKKIPDRNATTEGEAVRLGTVVWNGSQNLVTIPTLLGQSTPSVVATDYEVVVLGPYISKNDLFGSPYVYVGSIIGGTTSPGVSDITQQNLINQSVSSLSANEYDGGPNWADGTTNPATQVGMQIDKIIADLTDIVGVGGGAQRISIGGRGAWADGTINSARTTVYNAVNKIVQDLSSVLGAERIGSRQSTFFWNDGTSIPAGTVHQSVSAILQALGGTAGSAKIGAAARSNWLGGRSNPSASIQTALDKVITDLAVNSGSDDGASRIGVGAGPLGRISAGSVRSQLQQLESGAALVTNIRGQAISPLQFTPFAGDKIVADGVGNVSFNTNCVFLSGLPAYNDNVVIPNIALVDYIFLGTNSNQNWTITGILRPPSGPMGIVKTLINASGYILTLAYNSPNSTNRFSIRNTLPFVMDPWTSVIIHALGTQWYIYPASNNYNGA